MKLRKQISGHFNSNVSNDEKKKYHGSNFPLAETEIQSLFHLVQVYLGYLFVWFQSLQLSSARSESPHTLILLASKSHASSKVCTEL
jgi:hypothetical protein